MLTRFDKDVTRIRPQVVVVLGGINDFERVPLSSTEQNLKAMAERADRNNIRVVLATLPPVGLSAGERDPNASILAQDAGRDKIRALNDWIKDFAARKQYTVVDYHSALTDERGFYLKGLTSDGIHPSAQGYARMERLLSEAIRSAAPQGGK
jgi:lysophospholipase L1-like esterase